MNTDILDAVNYKMKVSEIIYSFCEGDYSSTQKSWEMFKIRIREFSQQFCRTKALDRKNYKL